MSFAAGSPAVVWYNNNGTWQTGIVVDEQPATAPPPPVGVSILVLEVAGNNPDGAGTNTFLPNIAWRPDQVGNGEAGPVGASMAGGQPPSIPTRGPIVWYNDGGTPRPALIREYGPEWVSLLVLTPEGEFTLSVVTWSESPEPGEAGPIGSIPWEYGPHSPEGEIGNCIWYHNLGGQTCTAIVVGYSQTYDGDLLTEQLDVVVLGADGDIFHHNGVTIFFQYPQVGNCSPAGVPTYTPPTPPSPTECVWEVIATGGANGYAWAHVGAACPSTHACDNSSLPALPDERYRPGARYYLPCIEKVPVPSPNTCQYEVQGGQWVQLSCGCYEGHVCDEGMLTQPPPADGTRMLIPCVEGGAA